MPIRPATPADAADITVIYAPIVTGTTISFETVPPTVQEMAQRLSHTLLTLPWLVHQNAQGRVDGYVYASKWRERAAYQWSVEVTAYVHEDARGLGLAKRLYARLFDELTVLGYHQAMAGITLPNVASVALHESMGFTPVGVFRNVGHKLGAWRDVGYWQRGLQALQPTQPPVTLTRYGGA